MCTNIFMYTLQKLYIRNVASCTDRHCAVKRTSPILHTEKLSPRRILVPTTAYSHSSCCRESARQGTTFTYQRQIFKLTAAYTTILHNVQSFSRYLLIWKYCYINKNTSAELPYILGANLMVLNK